jgi:hypothetical protein
VGWGGEELVSLSKWVNLSFHILLDKFVHQFQQTDSPLVHLNRRRSKCRGPGALPNSIFYPFIVIDSYINKLITFYNQLSYSNRKRNYHIHNIYININVSFSRLIFFFKSLYLKEESQLRITN